MSDNLPTIAPSPAMMCLEMIKAGVDVEKLEKMLDLQKQWEANEAKKAYHKAMAAFKADPPKIVKDRHVRYQTSKGVTEYDHASLAQVTGAINQALGKYELSASWKTTQDGRSITVTCTVTHALGHSESTSLTGMADESGGKNLIQSVGSTVSYLQRYTILAITGLATHDMDDDGASSEPVETISEKQVEVIRDLFKQTQTDETKWLAFAKISAVDELPANQFKDAKAMLEKKKAKMAKPQREPGEDG